MPSRASIVSFADESTPVTVAKHIGEVEDTANWIVVNVKVWLGAVGWFLAKHKNEVAKNVENMYVKVVSHFIRSSTTLK